MRNFILILFILAWSIIAATNARASVCGSNDERISIENKDCAGGFCFTAGTLIATTNGKKPVEKIKVGDMVWAGNPIKRKNEMHEVTGIYSPTVSALVEVVTTSKEKIDCTPLHLFWTFGKGWIAAKALFPGVQLLQRDGTFTKVFNVIPKYAPKTVVYGFEVDGLHTYYVGIKGLLVRDKNPAGE